MLNKVEFGAQHVETISKVIAHNVDRMQHYILLLIRGLHQSLKTKALYIT